MSPRRRGAVGHRALPRPVERRGFAAFLLDLSLDAKSAPRPLASSPYLVALTSWFRAVRVPPRCRNRLHAILSSLFLLNLSWPTFATQPYQHRNIGLRFGDGVAANVHSLFSPQRISRSESGFIANVGCDDENNIPDARRVGRQWQATFRHILRGTSVNPIIR